MRRKFGRTSFRPRRRRQRVSWLTNPELYGQEAIETRTPYGDPTEPVWIPLTPASNDWISSHPRFAKANDVMRLRRIVGQVRIGMYRADASQNETDYLVNYGLCLLKGDYDAEGNWTRLDEPDPEDPSDEDDKWLFKNFVILSTGAQYIEDGYPTGIGAGCPSGLFTAVYTEVEPCPNLTQYRQSWPLRQVMMSTDAQLPNGSFVDLKTRRKVQYAEKLFLVVTVQGADDASMSIFANWRLRVLTA